MPGQVFKLLACVLSRKFKERGWRFDLWELTGEVKSRVGILLGYIDQLEVELTAPFEAVTYDCSINFVVSWAAVFDFSIVSAV